MANQSSRSTASLRCAVAVAVCATLATTLAGLVPRSANAQTGCDWYARTALEQQRANIEHKCNFKGPAWLSDRAAHAAWCASVPAEQWKRQAQQREQELARCIGGR